MHCNQTAPPKVKFPQGGNNFQTAGFARPPWKRGWIIHINTALHVQNKCRRVGFKETAP